MNCQSLLIKALESRSISIRSFALKLGVTASSMGDTLHRTKSMSVDKFVQYLDALGYDVVVKDRINGKEFDVVEVGGSTK